MCVCSPKSDIDQVMRFDADRALLKQHFTPSLVGGRGVESSHS